MTELDSYFAPAEIAAVRRHIEIFHGRFLMSDKLGRADAVLLALYMLCNEKKASEALNDELRQFSLDKLRMDRQEFSKGLYDVKHAEYVSDRNKSLSLTFRGLGRVRDLLTLSEDSSRARTK